MGRPQVEVTTSERAGAKLVHVVGEIDLSTVPQLQRELQAAISGQDSIVVDLQGVRFIDSTGVGVLFRASTQVQESGGEVRIVCPPGPVRRVLKVSGLESLVAVFDDLEAAERT